ncbi:RNA-binding protein [Vagococcus penaei]|uniref:RNA-binding protein KhpB n=1 Tax=Vagococcus penaei TaxID=633807 RepID=A0A1Q2D6D4_9ENTE|nr:RNA-binding cell elongation regulator Jag/EloR [Vagococcus penaei]AQP53883.1 RNA-binding protein [Vagococcus penaei]RSU02953.1 RNA-binding protein [Vagococcus penaei]
MPKFTGDTVEQAIESGLRALKVKRSDVSVDILTEGKKGFLGIGKKLAEVSLQVNESVVEMPKEPLEKEGTAVVVDDTAMTLTSTNVTETTHEQITEDLVSDSQTHELVNLTDDDAITEIAIFLTDITSAMDAPAVVEIEQHNSHLIFHLETDKKGLLIGKHGKVLNAIQYLVQVHMHRIAKNRLTVTVNVGDYRERREAILERLAKRTAHEVRETGQPVFLEPMPAFERKMVHHLLSKDTDLRTHSEGKEPHRYLVVELDQ